MTKEKIMLAALRLFLVRGYNSVSLTDVAQAAGITKGGVYHYFMSKEDLVHCVFQFLFERFEAKYFSLLNCDKTMQEILQQLLVRQEIEYYSQKLLGLEGNKPVDYAQFAIEVMRKFPDLQAQFEQSFSVVCTAMAEKITDSANQGEIRAGLDSQALAATILSILNGCNILGGQFQALALREQIAENLWNLMKA